jgi:hypothetical protein
LDTHDKQVSDSSSSCQDDCQQVDQHACKKQRRSLEEDVVASVSTSALAAGEHGFGHYSAWKSQIYQRINIDFIPTSSDTIRPGTRPQVAAVTTLPLITLETVSKVYRLMLKDETYEHSMRCQQQFAVKTMSDAKTVISPHLLFSLLQCVPEFSAANAIAMTADASTRLTAMIEDLATNLIQQAGKLITERLSECLDFKPCISSRELHQTIQQAEATPIDFKSLFGGCYLMKNRTWFEVSDVGIDKDRRQEAYDDLFPQVRENERAFAAFEDEFDQAVSPCLYPLYCTANFVRGSLLHCLDMLVRLPVSALDSRVDVPTYSANVFQRQLQALETLSKEQRAEYDRFIDKPDIQWKIRDNEVYAAQCSPFPAFDLVDIHVLCATLVNEIEATSQAANLHMSAEACELIGCIVEHYVIDLMKRSLQVSQYRDFSIVLVDDIYRSANL